MPAQQKPKKDRGTRNGDRCNGKAWSRNSVQRATPKVRTVKGYLGYSFKRIDKMAAEAGVERHYIMEALFLQRQKRNEYRYSMPPSLRRQLAREIELKHLRQRLYGRSSGE